MHDRQRDSGSFVILYPYEQIIDSLCILVADFKNCIGM